jgi:protein-disulfide isomerase
MAREDKGFVPMGCVSERNYMRLISGLCRELVVGAILCTSSLVCAQTNPSKDAGITSEQADAILKELKEIRTLLEKQLQLASNGTHAQGTSIDSQNVSIKLPQDIRSLGKDNAPVTIVEFSDYQCPFCSKFHKSTFAELKKNYIEPGTVRFISLDLPLDFHPNAAQAAEAVRCAGDQGKFWEMRDAMIEHSDNLSKESILTLASSIVNDPTALRVCMESGKYKAAVESNKAEANKTGVTGTPTFIVGKTAKESLSGPRLVGAMPYTAFDFEIKKILAEHR